METKEKRPDEYYMMRAIKLARRGEGMVSPNPLVGAVIVKSGRIIGEGYHRRFGGPHAEIEALGRAGGSVRGATMHVTLEPCCHQGKTPPCTESLIAAGLARVVVGTPDPNPLVSGKGLAILGRHGMETAVGVLADECARLNERFFTFMRTGIPFVTLKFAQTLDGRIACANGHSRWISSAPSLRFAHRLRALHDAVVVGVDTVIQDNPLLTVRLARGRNPLRIVVDSALRIPPDAGILKDQDAAKTIIATTRRADAKTRTGLEGNGRELLTVDADRKGRVDLLKLLSELGRRGVSSVLVEGGSALITSVLKEQLANRLVAIIAPKIVGTGIDAVGDLGIRNMDDALVLTDRKVYRLGDDLIVDARFTRPAGC
jgi:diaminohydroxyphosphoribosylaminopyrimidine deaminase / 5-amino-6-(5-phosphoribosylamino)uracil reductase